MSLFLLSLEISENESQCVEKLIVLKIWLYCTPPNALVLMSGFGYSQTVQINLWDSAREEESGFSLSSSSRKAPTSFFILQNMCMPELWPHSVGYFL